MTPSPDQIALTQHLLQVVSNLPADLRSVIDHGDSVTFEMSAEQYARQCHVNTLYGSATITYAELLARTEPQWEGDPDTDWDAYAAERLIKERWEADLAERRRTKRAY